MKKIFALSLLGLLIIAHQNIKGNSVIGLWYQCNNDGKYEELYIAEHYISKAISDFKSGSHETDIALYKSDIEKQRLIITEGINVALRGKSEVLSYTIKDDNSITIIDEYGSKVFIRLKDEIPKVDTSDLNAWSKLYKDGFIKRAALACCDDVQTKEEKEHSTTGVSTNDQASPSDTSASYDSQKVDKILIDKIHYFSATDEIFMHVWVKKNNGILFPNSLLQSLDSLVFRNDTILRQRLPFGIAEQYFDMELLDGIMIFNNEHVALGTSSIKRIEYYSDPKYNEFIAILEKPQGLTGTEFYGINGEVDQLLYPFTYSKVQDSSLLDSIHKHHHFEAAEDYKFGGIRIEEPYNTTYAFYSFLNETHTASYCIFEIDSNKVELLDLANPGLYILDMIPTALMVNKKPVLLLENDMSGTTWFSPAIFDGKGFVSTYNRVINLQDFTENE